MRDELEDCSHLNIHGFPFYDLSMGTVYSDGIYKLNFKTFYGTADIILEQVDVKYLKKLYLQELTIYRRPLPDAPGNYYHYAVRFSLSKKGDN